MLAVTLGEQRANEEKAQAAENELPNRNLIVKKRNISETRRKQLWTKFLSLFYFFSIRFILF